MSSRDYKLAISSATSEAALHLWQYLKFIVFETFIAVSKPADVIEDKSRLRAYDTSLGLQNSQIFHLIEVTTKSDKDDMRYTTEMLHGK